MTFFLFRSDMDAFGMIPTPFRPKKGSNRIMSRCPSNPEGWGRKSALSDKVSGPLLTRTCGAT